MIWESQPWKEGLLADADNIENLRFDDALAEVRFEKSIFLTGFVCRKLLEAKKLTDRAASYDVKCTKYAPLDGGRIPDLLNWHRLGEFYDFATPRKATVKLTFFANQLVHSFIFAPTMNEEDETRIFGFYVASDNDRAKFLYQYEITEIIKMMRLIGNDSVVCSKFVRSDKREWVVRNYGESDPEAKEDFIELEIDNGFQRQS
ncbi:hypothetical protein [Ensifer adhaerens]|uniref:hypothetical protein n=1 Tax=Ensifer adhaerens TaxID=106592 RepID=UPI001C4DF34B|nr:hypothetical protein [Ensifer adhaerens]MBW0369540.1 hypothetical protein [Ensifer adhaerens]UCM21347.1 hypothetical protein LDL63_07165 [Ensifer adhaerens]